MLRMDPETSAAWMQALGLGSGSAAGEGASAGAGLAAGLGVLSVGSPFSVFGWLLLQQREWVKLKEAYPDISPVVLASRYVAVSHAGLDLKTTDLRTVRTRFSRRGTPRQRRQYRRHAHKQFRLMVRNLDASLLTLADLRARVAERKRLEAQRR